jgi:hypothetical protein
MIRSARNSRKDCLVPKHTFKKKKNFYLGGFPRISILMGNTLYCALDAEKLSDQFVRSICHSR